MKKAIKVKPTDVVIVCVPDCNCGRECAKTTTDLANVVFTGMPICMECGEEMTIEHVEVHLEGA